jgi:hypothetical protein
MASPTLRDNFAATVELYSTFIKQMKAENPRLNVSEISFARGKGSKNSFGKRGSSGISNVSNAAVGDRFFENHEYHALTPDQNNTLRLKRLKSCHVSNCQGGGGNGSGKGNYKCPTLKSLNLSIAELATKFDKFTLPNYYNEDESSEEEEGSSNRSNVALNCHSKEEEARQKLKGKCFRFHYAPGIC